MKNFYESVLPTQGVYCVAGIDPSGRILNVFAESLDDVTTNIKMLADEKVNVFVAPASFINHSRRAENAAFVRSFFVDLDVGSEKAYQTQQAALAALATFLDSTGLPPPIRVNSGRGIHAYWVFDQDVPVSEWKPYAKKFKNFCLEHGLSIDPVVTADAARIMRSPDTFNYKGGTPVATAVIDVDIHVYDWLMFKEFLGEVEPDLSSILSGVEKGLDDDTKKMLKTDNFETLFSRIAEKSLNGDGCAQIKHVLIHAATLPEPLWYGGLSIARHCEDWETAIHLMSEDYPGYNREHTIRKAEQTYGKPQSCLIFEANNPGGCNGCPFKGKITNPLSIGRQLRQEPEATEVTSPTFSLHVTTFTMPKAMYPYMRGVNGGIYFVPPAEKSKDGKSVQPDPIKLTAHDFYPIKRMFNETNGAVLRVRNVLPNDPVREFNLDMKDVYLKDRLITALTKNEILFKPSVAQHVMNYIVKWGEYMVSSDAAEQMRMQMGWTEQGDSFVIGETEITSTGAVLSTASSPFIRGIAKLMKPSGEYSIWKDAANALNEPGFETHAFSLLLGFGSPLMRFTSTSGVVVSLVGETGSGKTGALYGGLSIFGNPKELSVFDATDNGMIGRYLGLHNIMLGCDEVSNKRADQLSNLIHRISHGKAKIRMQASVNAERELEMSASMIGFMTSNQSIYDKLTELKASPDGEVARLVEFIMRVPKPLKEDPRRGKKIFDALRLNYGHAGPEFIQYCFKVGFDYIKARIAKWVERFNTDFAPDSSYRFYENLVSVTMTAGDLAVEAGIIKYDIERIYTHVVREMISIRENTIRLNDTDYRGLIGEFMGKHDGAVLIMNGDKVVTEPRSHHIIARSEIHNQRIMVSKAEFRKFLSTLQVSRKEFEIALKADGLLIETVKKQRLSSGWKAGIQTPPIAVYCFKYDTEHSGGKH